jgi:hypothetical protein
MRRRFNVVEAVRCPLSCAAGACGLHLAMDSNELVPMKGHEGAVTILPGNLLRMPLHMRSVRAYLNELFNCQARQVWTQASVCQLLPAW